jgi:arginyl-tRNA synthetase
LITSVNCEWQYLNIKLNNGIYTKSFLDNIKSNKNPPVINDIPLIKGDYNNDSLIRLDYNKEVPLIKGVSDRTRDSSKETIIIDYIWANVWKPLHIWHMCTPNQWQAIYNVYKRLWCDVIWDSHIWDWWIIFWKLILAYKLYWDEQKLKENAVEHLFELYVRITEIISIEKEIFKNSLNKEFSKWNNITESLVKLENIDKKRFNEFLSYLELEINNGWLLLETITEKEIRNEFKSLSTWNSESIKLWEKFTKESIKAMNIQLNRLNIQPDFDIWESFYEWLNLPKLQNYPDLTYNMNSIVNELLEKKIAIKNDDLSVWVVFPEETKIPSCVLQKRDWSNLYFTSDLCAIKYRVTNWSVSKILYFVDVRQQLHLKQAFEIAKMAWWLNVPLNKGESKGDFKVVELFHAYNWFISLKDWAMSTRKWRIIKLDKLLDEAEARAKNIILEKRDDINWEELDKLSKIIWIWAIKYGYLKKSRETDVIFDWDEFMTFEWNSWPYIQYAYVRAIRILEKISTSPMTRGDWEGSYPKSHFEHIDEIELVKELLNYESVLNDTAKTCFPHILAWYCYSLTKKFNAFYNNVQVISEENLDLKNLRLLLVQNFAETLKEWFNLLWIDMPDKM